MKFPRTLKSSTADQFLGEHRFRLRLARGVAGILAATSLVAVVNTISSERAQALPFGPSPITVGTFKPTIVFQTIPPTIGLIKTTIVFQTVPPTIVFQTVPPTIAIPKPTVVAATILSQPPGVSVPPPAATTGTAPVTLPSSTPTNPVIPSNSLSVIPSPTLVFAPIESTPTVVVAPGTAARPALTLVKATVKKVAKGKAAKISAGKTTVEKKAAATKTLKRKVVSKKG